MSPLWAAVTPRRDQLPPLTGGAQADVAVLGAGFTGLSAALHLARKGACVAVIEAHHAGFGASGRNSGQVIPTMSGIEPDAMVQLHGEAGERFAHLVAHSAAGLFDLVRREEIACEAEQAGWFQPAHSPDRLSLSAARVEAWARRGAPVRLLDAGESARLIGSSAWHGGMLNTSGGHLNPLALVNGLLQRASTAGAAIYENTPALSVERTGVGFAIRTPGGVLQAKQVILATNAYTGAIRANIAPRLAHSIIPVITWQMATAPLPKDVQRAILPGRQAVSDTRGDLRFFRWDQRGRLITGGALIVPFSAASRLKHRIGGVLQQAFPMLGPVTFDYVWSGRIGMTADRTPRFFKLEEGVWAWTGCNGRGVALAVAVGQQLAEAALGADPKDLALPFSTPWPYPFHSLLTAGAPAMLALYRLRDRLPIFPKPKRNTQ